MQENVLMAFALTLFAGLSTGIGSAIAFFSRKTNKTFLSVSLGFSAGVMIYVSFVEIFRKANDSFLQIYAPREAAIWTMGGFFAGILLILIIDKLIPSHENPHTPMSYDKEEAGQLFQMKKHYSDEMRLMRMGLFTALAIAIHNFPEGLATFTAAMTNPAIGISIAVAIAIHNIPEGIAVSVPIYHATGSKKKAFWLSFSSGVSEPVGAFLGYMLLKNLFNPFTFGFLFAAVAGIMVFISIDELIPTSREYDSGHKSIYGLVAGMAVMGISLVLFM